jgi:hypothetical protein
LNKPSDYSVLGFTLSLFVWLMMPCLCGHHGGHALLGAVPGALLAWVGLVKNQSTHIITRCGLGVATVATTFLLLKVMMDILWTGHEPLFAQPYWVERWIYWWEYLV